MIVGMYNNIYYSLNTGKDYEFGANIVTRQVMFLMYSVNDVFVLQQDQTYVTM